MQLGTRLTPEQRPFATEERVWGAVSDGACGSHGTHGHCAAADAAGRAGDPAGRSAGWLCWDYELTGKHRRAARDTTGRDRCSHAGEELGGGDTRMDGVQLQAQHHGAPTAGTIAGYVN
eukprot:scaffold2201_cov240-Pinguiococcus_pyrenoidosus.AAC.2